MKTELRLNNYVFGIYIEETENADIEEKCICSVDVIDGVGCTEYNIWASSIEDKGKLIEEWESFKPIPLTEKWLLDFGWGKDEYDSVYVDNTSLKQVVLYYDVKNKMFLMETNSDIIEFNHIQHVHQLQNLYFALTGEELTINTPTRE